MSRGRTEASLAGGAPAPTPPLFEHEIRHDMRVVARLQAHETPDGFVVESYVFPKAAQDAAEPVAQPFAFATLAHARRFVDEAIVAFEYLNCSVV